MIITDILTMFNQKLYQIRNDFDQMIRKHLKLDNDSMTTMLKK
jgi:hypothetical protein